MAMESRGYVEGAETTRMHPLSYDRADRCTQGAMWLLFLVLEALLIWDRVGF